ncbi:MAG: polymorphic toxin type 47 domain-containing protein [Gammaproteobacteria bacterium]
MAPAFGGTGNYIDYPPGYYGGTGNQSADKWLLDEITRWGSRAAVCLYLATYTSPYDPAVAACDENPTQCPYYNEENTPDFDEAREKAFEEAGLTNPDDVEISKVDPETGTATEFKGPNGAKVGYDGPHDSPGPHHDTQHISWQSGGKRANGGRRGNIPYSGPKHPSRPGRK